MMFNDWLLDCAPRDVQLEALRRAGHPRPYRGFAYFMEMRLGKTPTALNDFMLLKRDHRITKHIVVAPNKYKSAWKLEAAKFGVDVPCHVFESKQRKQAEEFIEEHDSYQLSLNYEALVSPATVDLLSHIVDEHTLLTLDESIAIKSPTAKTSKTARFLAAKAGYVRILTGKPVVQGPQDLWSQLRAIGELQGSNYYAFRNRFCVMGGFKAKQVIGARNEAELGFLMRARCFVASRKDWMDTYESDFEIRPVEMLPAQRRAYDDFNANFLLEFEGGVVAADQVITKHLKLQQLSSGFMYDEQGKPLVLVPMGKLPKFLDMKEAIDTEIKGKTLIVCIFKHTINELIEQFPGAAVIRGGMSSDDVDEAKRRFNEDADCRVMIGQIKAIKYGHTLMGSAEDPCLNIYYFENSYSLDDRSQSEQRPQGAGQISAIHIVDYATCPIERTIAKALQRKENIAKTIINHYKGET